MVDGTVAYHASRGEGGEQERNRLERSTWNMADSVAKERKRWRQFMDVVSYATWAKRVF